MTKQQPTQENSSTQPELDEYELFERRSAVNFGIANVELEGFKVSKEAREIGEQYAQGLISLDEVTKRINLLHPAVNSN